MNSERRHELQENELASVLDRVNTKIEPYSKPIAVVVAIAFIGLLGWGFYSSLQAEHRSDATYQLIEGSVRGDSETLATVAATYPETPMAAWARLYQGSQKMGAGINSLFTSRDEAEELLNEASSAYEEALSLSKETLIQSRANYGLARIAESLGKTDEAIGYYEATMDAGESVEMMTEAQQRIKLLSKPAAKSFMVWFDEQDFTPADPSLPPALPANQMLPDLPDLSFPDIEASSQPDAASAAQEAMDESAAVQTEKAAPTESEQSASPEKDQNAGVDATSDKSTDMQPSTDKPASDKPASDKPASDDVTGKPPVDDKPAVEEATQTEAGDSPASTEPMTDENNAPAEDKTVEPAADPSDTPEKTAPEKSESEESKPADGETDEAINLEAPSNS